MKFVLLIFLASFTILTAESGPVLQYGGGKGSEQNISGPAPVAVKLSKDLVPPQNIQHPNRTDFIVPESGVYLVGYKMRLINFSGNTTYTNVSVMANDPTVEKETNPGLPPGVTVEDDGFREISTLTTIWTIDPKTNQQVTASAQMLVSLGANSVLRAWVNPGTGTPEDGFGIYDAALYIIKVGQ